MSPAKRNRQTAIGMLSELYLPTPANDDAWDRQIILANPHYQNDGTSPELFEYKIRGIADNIRKLLTLGRTDRWQAAISRWANMVSESGNEMSLRWAFLQGMVYAGHASE